MRDTLSRASRRHHISDLISQFYSQRILKNLIDTSWIFNSSTEYKSIDCLWHDNCHRQSLHPTLKQLLVWGTCLKLLRKNARDRLGCKRDRLGCKRSPYKRPPTNITNPWADQTLQEYREYRSRKKSSSGSTANNLSIPTQHLKKSAQG